MEPARGHLIIENPTEYQIYIHRKKSTMYISNQSEIYLVIYINNYIILHTNDCLMKSLQSSQSYPMNIENAITQFEQEGFIVLEDLLDGGMAHFLYQNAR
jgi:hypothetical protein